MTRYLDYYYHHHHQHHHHHHQLLIHDHYVLWQWSESAKSDEHPMNLIIINSIRYSFTYHFSYQLLRWSPGGHGIGPPAAAKAYSATSELGDRDGQLSDLEEELQAAKGSPWSNVNIMMNIQCIVLYAASLSLSIYIYYIYICKCRICWYICIIFRYRWMDR